MNSCPLMRVFCDDASAGSLDRAPSMCTQPRTRRRCYPGAHPIIMDGHSVGEPPGHLTSRTGPSDAIVIQSRHDMLESSGVDRKAGSSTTGRMRLWKWQGFAMSHVRRMAPSLCFLIYLCLLCHPSLAESSERSHISASVTVPARDAARIALPGAPVSFNITHSTQSLNDIIKLSTENASANALMVLCVEVSGP